MRLNWVVILLAAIFVVLLLAFFINVDISGDNDKGGPAVTLVRR